MELFNEYFREELSIMPSYVKVKYSRAIKALIKEKQYEISKHPVENLFKSLVPIDDLLIEILDNHNELLKNAYLNIENNKSMKYSALFELIDERSVEDLIKFIVKDNTLDNALIDMSEPSRRQVKAIKLNEDTIKFTFLLQGIKISSSTPIPCKTTYSVIVKFWTLQNEQNKFIEISLDNVATYFRHDQPEFFENMIRMISNFLESEKLLSLEPLDLFEVLESIKDKEKKVS